MSLNNRFDIMKEAKVSLRKTLLKTVGEANVLDLSQRGRDMFDGCYSGNQYVKSYKGNEQLAEKINEKALLKDDLDKYNFYDLDVFRRPWELFFNIIIRLEGGGRRTFVITDKMSSSILQRAILRIPKGFTIPNLQEHHAFFLGRLFRKVENMTGYKLEFFKQSFLSEPKAKYYGFQLVK